MTELKLNAFAQEVYHVARNNGFYEREFIGDFAGLGSEYRNPSLPAEKLALVHTEVSEAVDALRADDFENESEEIADAVIRLLDYSAWRGIDLEVEVLRKMEKNRQRPYLHGKKF